MEGSEQKFYNTENRLVLAYYHKTAVKNALGVLTPRCCTGNFVTTPFFLVSVFVRFRTYDRQVSSVLR